MKKTVGEATIEASKQDMQSDYIELEREINKGTASKKSYEEEVWETIDRGRKDDKITGNFYVVVLFKKERHLRNVVRRLFFYRQSCPTPEFDQTVYRYIKKGDVLEFLWCVPNNATVLNLNMRSTLLPEDQNELKEMCRAFTSGDLDRLAERLNKEDASQPKGLILNG